MDSRTGLRGRFWAALVLLLAAVLTLTTTGGNASAASGSTNENRVKALAAETINAVGAGGHNSPGQRRGEALPQQDLAQGHGVHTYYVIPSGADGAAGPAVLVHNTSCPFGSSLDDLSASGARKAKGGLTRAGQKFNQHGGQGAFPAAKGNVTELNRLGQAQLDDILTNPGTVSRGITGGEFTGGRYYIAPDGRGAAFDTGGQFQYFGVFKP